MNPQVKSRKNLSATDARNLRTLLLLSVFEPEDIGARIAQARREAGLTQEELADLVGVATRSLQGYESGSIVPYRHMGKIAEFTAKTVVWLLHGEAEDAPPTQLERIEAQLAEIRGMLADQVRGEDRSDPDVAADANG